MMMRAPAAIYGLHYEFADGAARARNLRWRERNDERTMEVDSDLLERRQAVLAASVLALGAELLLDAQQLVVLGKALRAARSSGLDLASAQAHGEVGNERVLGLAAAVAGHHAPASGFGHIHRLDGLGDASDLVNLQQEGVASLLIDRLLHALRVGHQQVIAHDLAFVAYRRCHLAIRTEVILVERVLDGDDRVLAAESLVDLGKLLTCDLLAFVLGIALGLEVQGQKPEDHR